MFRHRSTDINGRPFTESVIQAVWDRAQASSNHPPLKLDSEGALIWREAYGNTNSKLGWEIDHLIPVEEGGGDDLENLQALQCENHRRKEQFLAPRIRAVEQNGGVKAAAA